MPRRLATALVALACLATPTAASAHRDHCTDPPDPVNQSGDLRLTDLGTIGSLTGVVAAPGEPGRVYLAGLLGLVWVMENDVVRPEPFLEHERGGLADGRHRGERARASVDRVPARLRDLAAFYVFTSDAVGDTRILEFKTTPDGASPIPPAAARCCSSRTASPGATTEASSRSTGAAGCARASATPTGRTSRRSAGATARSCPSIRIARGPRAGGSRGPGKPYRFAFDPFRGGIAIADVGEAIYDEINVLPRGFRRRPNYGWPYFEGPRLTPRRG